MFSTLQRVLIHYELGVPAITAEVGFKELGVETLAYVPGAEVGREVGLVAGVLEFQKLFHCPAMDYPSELREFLGRGVSRMPLSRAEKILDPVFIKPVEEKAFTGFVWRRDNPPPLYISYPKEKEVWVSDLVDFRAEFRCFVMDGRVLDVRLYKGDWGIAPDRGVVEAAVSAYTEAPRGYALDFGVTGEGRTLLVECNDGYALGPYGLHPRLYAELLEARWEELTRCMV